MRISVAFVFVLILCVPKPGYTQSTIDYLEKAGEVFFTNIDSAIYYLNQGQLHYPEQQEWESYINCYNGLASCYFYKGEFAKSLKYLNEAKAEAAQWIGKDNVAYSSLINNLAQVYAERGNYDLAIEHFHEAVKSAENNPKEEISFILSNLGDCYTKKGDIDQAILYLKRALREQRIDQDKDAPRSAVAYNALANAYRLNHQPDTALAILEKSIALYKTHNNAENIVMTRYHINAHYTMAEIFMERNDHAALLDQIEIIQQLELKYYKKLASRGQSLKGKWHLMNKNLPAAKISFEQALQANRTGLSDFTYHRDIGESHRQLGAVLFELADYKGSLAQYDAALQNFTHGSFDPKEGQYPPVDSLLLDRSLILALQGKGQALHQLYAESQDPRLVEAAMSTYDLAIQSLSKLRKEFHTEASKEILSELVTPLYEEAMDCLYKQYRMQPSELLLNKCFQLAEASKAVILVESINENLAKAISGIPDSSLLQEANLRNEIAYYESSLYELRGVQNADQDKINNLEKDFFDVRQRHQELVASFESLYPEYYRLKYEKTALPSIAELQSNLPDSTSVLLEYFVGLEKIYLFIVSKGGALVEVMPKQSNLTNQIEKLREQLHHPPVHQTAKVDFESFVSNSRALYKQVICESCLPESIDRLIIIPDDVLGYIPFEILLSEAAQLDEVNYRSNHLSYLFNDYKISYNYSASLWLKGPSDKKQAAKNLIAFAPDFSNGGSEAAGNRICNANELSELNCNMDEVNDICTLLAGKACTGAAANTSTFQSVANQYKILHFATHSCLDDTNPMSNKIFLADTYLSNYDLYNMRLDSDLAVLSACDTGNGQLLKGEGVMSLFRGFLHAGCASSLISLWAVEDCTTKEIMVHYYQHLKSGKSKDLAIQQARMDYLAQADRLRSHPFYWATFVQFGSISPIQFQYSNTQYWIWLGLAVFIFLGTIKLYRMNR